jgi:hypothetical protein
MSGVNASSNTSRASPRHSFDANTSSRWLSCPRTVNASIRRFTRSKRSDHRRTRNRRLRSTYGQTNFDRLCRQSRATLAAYERDRERSGPVTIALG